VTVLFILEILKASILYESQFYLTQDLLADFINFNTMCYNDASNLLMRDQNRHLLIDGSRYVLPERRSAF
jgi:hypothetical protein